MIVSKRMRKSTGKLFVGAGYWFIGFCIWSDFLFDVYSKFLFDVCFKLWRKSIEFGKSYL